MGQNIEEKKSCNQCGACCHMQILMTILDIHRIARFKEETDRTMFNKIIGDISKNHNLFLITKKENYNECIFLNENNLCKIQQVKPNVCRFYQCSHQNGEKEINWTAHYRDISQKYKLWEQSIASKITEKYIDANGNNWNKEDYFKDLNSIKDNIKTIDSQKLKLGRIHEGDAISMLYDCSKCDKRGECAKATSITLDDVQRISEYLDISVRSFFEKYISHEKCLATGGLKLKRDKHCILFNFQKQECSVKEVRPLHCHFTTCPLKTKSSETREILYPGSGTIEGQFRHQVALQITREYVSQSGINYSPKMMNDFLNQLENAIKNPKNLKEFVEKIKKYR